MNKLIHRIAVAALSVAMIACTDAVGLQSPDNENVTDIPKNGKIELSINGIIEGYTPQDGTKASAQNVVRIMWSGGEKVYVYDGTQSIGTLTASIAETDGTYAKLSGTITAPSGNKPVTLVYSPQFDSAPAVDIDGNISLDLSTQDSSEVPFLIYGSLPSDIIADNISNTIVTFVLATSVYKCNCAGLVRTGSIQKAVIGKTNTRCVLSLSDTGNPVVGGSTPGSITRSSGITASDERAIFSIALAKADAATERTIEITKGGSTQCAAFAKTEFQTAKAYNSVFAFDRPLETDALPGKFTVDAGGKTVRFSKGNLRYMISTGKWEFFYNQYDTDPLTYNSTSDEYISLFTWGYVSGESGSTQRDHKTFIRDHIIDGENFDYEEDWGSQISPAGTWRTLSCNEWRYLVSVGSYNNPTREGLTAHNVTVMGKPGCVILYPDGYDRSKVVPNDDTSTYDSIDVWAAAQDDGVVCLPAAGCRFDNQAYNNYGYYWSSTGNGREAELFNSYILNLFGGAPDIIPSGNRSMGASVRLVTDVR